MTGPGPAFHIHKAGPSTIPNSLRHRPRSPQVSPILVPAPLAYSPARRDWDLWGPLILCLALAIILSLNAPPAQSLGVFTSVIVLISVGSLVVTVQAKLLGGRVSFFQGLCVLGYCVAPLDIAALVSMFVRLIYVRVPVTLAAWAWCIWG